MSILEAILLGLVQGLTEFLPVSSSGHIELGKHLLGVEGSTDLAFSILVHGATVLSIIVVFFKDIWALIKNLFSFSWNPSTQYVAKLALSMLPVGIVGVLFKSELESLFEGKLFLVGCCLIITGFLLFLTRLERKKTKNISFLNALLIGVGQAVAILPGISRSGTTISLALALGASRTEATRFSFLMVLAPILGATLLEFKDLLEITNTQSSGMLIPYIAGFIAAFLSGLLACKWMLAIVQKGKIIYFSIYCFIVGAIAIFVGLIG